MKIMSLPEDSLQTSVLIGLSLDCLFDFLLTVNEIKIPLLKLSEYFVHLVGIIEKQMLLS